MLILPSLRIEVGRKTVGFEESVRQICTSCSDSWRCAMCKRSLCVLVLAVCILTIPVSADLVGWWKFDDGSGTTAADSSGRGQNGTLTNEPTWSAAGVYGGCLQFDGTNDRVAITGTWTLPQYTVAFWFRQDGGVGSQKTLICLQNSTVGASGIMCEIGTDGRVRFSHRAPFAATGGAANENLYVAGPATGTWHHLALVKTATDMMTYIDGVQAATQANANTFDMAGTSLTIGDLDNRQMRPWNGPIDDVRIYNTALTLAEIQQVKSNIGNRGYSTSPRPADKAADVLRETALIWNRGEFAAAHDVYLGTSPDDVANATRAKPLGVLVMQDLDVNSFDPAGRFDLGQTCYWRVDEVNAPPSSTIFKGDVWSFTVEPYSRAITGVTAVADSVFDTKSLAQKSCDGSGLNTADQHSTTSAEMWISAKSPWPHWIEYTFDRVYKLDQMWVWN
ncbi:MAG: LamG domain-containing protein, partial [Planctomycetaceae bacterium]